MQKRDIENRDDLQYIIRKFYDALMADPDISYIFTDVAQINIVEHLDLIVDFWENVIFHSSTYQGNTMQVHLHLHEKTRLNTNHFNIWLRHFNAAVDLNYAGAYADKMKSRAFSIATVMQVKISMLEKDRLEKNN